MKNLDLKQRESLTVAGSKRFRVAIIRQKYTPYGGAERFIEVLLHTLHEQNLEIELTLISRKWKSDSTSTIRFIKCNPFYVGRLWRDWSFYKAACNIIKQEQFDLVQSHERITCSDIYRAGEGVHQEWLNQRWRAQPWLIRAWNSVSPYHRFILNQEKRVFENPNLLRIIANSEIIRQEIVRNFPECSASIHVISNAVDQTKFSPKLKQQYRLSARKELGIPIDAYTSIFVGSGYERKGVKTLIEVFRGLPDNHHLIVIGKDKNIKHFMSLSAKHELRNRIHFLGPKEDVRPFLGAADLFVFPSLYDPLPNSALEAAAAGLPILASKTTGAAELTDAIGLPTLDPLDISAWTEAILALSKSPSQKPIDMSKYSAQAMAHSLGLLYQNIMRQKS